MIENPTDEKAPYLVYRYIAGCTFRQLRILGTTNDLVEAASSIGHTLRMLVDVDIATLTHIGLTSNSYTTHDAKLHLPILELRLGGANFTRMHRVLSRWQDELVAIDSHACLVHGDFNHGNVIMDYVDGRWSVVALIDWEFAHIGPMLTDCARFMRYAAPDASTWEPYFLGEFDITPPILRKR